MGKQCKKCGYERQPTDTQQELECPKCGAIYAKVEQYLARQKQEMEKKESEKAAQKIIEENTVQAIREIPPEEQVSIEAFRKDRDDALNKKAAEARELALKKNFTTMARQSLKEYWGKAAIATVLYFVTPGVIFLLLFGTSTLFVQIQVMQYVFFVLIPLGFFATFAAMNVGFCKFTLLLSRKEEATFLDMFCAFNFKKYCDGFFAVFLMFLYTLIPILIISLILIVPIYFAGFSFPMLILYLYSIWWIILILGTVIGIVIIIPYIMTFFVFVDYEDKGKDIGASDALRISKDMMQGNKLGMLSLLLRFVPWYLLSLFIEFKFPSLSFLTFLVSLFLIPYVLVSIAHYYDVIWARRAAKN